MAAGAQHARILIIDDDAGLLRLMSQALKREGFSAISTASSGAEVLKRAPREEAALMLVDLRLADMSGQELLQRLQQSGISTPFVVITGEGDERVAVDLMKQGALDYLVKDAEFLETMPTRVRRAVESIQQKQRLTAAEEALRREHAFLSAILDTAGALVVVLDSEGRIVRFNRAAEQLTGFSSEEVLGKNYLDTFIIDRERAEMEAIFDRLGRGEPDIRHQNHIRTRTAEPRLVTWSNTHIRGPDGRAEFIIKTGIDTTERRRLEEEISRVSGREQRRIGQDLHDGLGQHLTGIELMSQCLEQALSKKKRPEAEQAAKISEHVRDAIRQTKSLARGLSPVELERHGLMSALQELCASTTEICRIRCRFDCPDPVLVENNTLATHLYRIAQEAVNNAVKHGKTTDIVVRLAEVNPDKGELSVRDNGTGFASAEIHHGMGLSIMKYRASVIGATLELRSSPGAGTEVKCSFPRAV